ncbi:SUMF1/EgtB/PvdO family nonheme iron enzyme [Hymenobacter sp. M29]|uniref:SUMF1/EgtB/PvdO family nonheme iron enzyme n=1 Tax=Hymenobacter mellowenesis TaxID=3063995 RepID=A0ABT9ACY9_9BACT|nr:SUMF1/EgtB/PvdO family nonheme iron enzyme [Hymenobacter sp. M29]MDO7847705.1 SUMF1/EgtB/PvdO family nonheme iron enzyme [Hymenobacter sp. M29]
MPIRCGYYRRYYPFFPGAFMRNFSTRFFPFRRRFACESMGSLVATFGLAGCMTVPPSSSYPGLYSTTTGLQNISPEMNRRSSALRDYEVLTYQPDPTCKDTSQVVKDIWSTLKSVPHAAPIGMPGCLLLTRDGLGIDESEVPNIEWKRYQLRLAALGRSIAATQPATASLPVPDYFTNTFYDFYPVVGLSYEQVMAFCQWRGQAIEAALNRNKPVLSDSKSPAYVAVECRLPTEAEWEKAALAGRGLPYGSRCSEAPIRVNPKAAAYLKVRSGSPESVDKIEADIKAYNQRKPVRPFIVCNQPEPYFLRQATPAYVFQTPSNDYQVFHLLGNVSEMMQERGITRGGNFRDPLSACTVAARGTYNGPAPTIGFRCVLRATLPNQR